MKILIVNTVPTDRNGITNVIMNFVMAMDKSAMTIDMVTINEPDKVFREGIERYGGKVFVLPRTGKKILKYWNGLRKVVKSGHYNIVHIHGNSHTTVLDLSASRAAGCVVSMVHAHTTACDHAVVHFLMTPVFNMLCTVGLACGEKAGKFMFGQKTFHVINNGVDTKRFAFNDIKRFEVRKKLGWTHDNKVIGHVGYFLEVKNHRFILDVFSELYKTDKKYRLLLIGDGLLRPEMEKRVQIEGLSDAIQFAGNIDNVNDYLNAMDLILMPSLYEGLPLSLMEQQANGLKCVVSDTITREVDKTGNLTFISLDTAAEDWANYIKTLNLKENRKHCSDVAIEKIKSSGYSISDEAGKLRNIYEESIKNKVFL